MLTILLIPFLILLIGYGGQLIHFTMELLDGYFDSKAEFLFRISPAYVPYLIINAFLELE